LSLVDDPSSDPAYRRPEDLTGETNKNLLLKHIEGNQAEGSPLKDLMDVLPFLTRGQVRTLLDELRKDETARPRGLKRGVRWYPGREDDFGGEI